MGWDGMGSDGKRQTLSDKQTKKTTANKKVLHTTKRALRLFGNTCTMHTQWHTKNQQEMKQPICFVGVNKKIKQPTCLVGVETLCWWYWTVSTGSGPLFVGTTVPFNLHISLMVEVVNEQKKKKGIVINRKKNSFWTKQFSQRRRQISRSIASELTHELFGELLRTFSGARAVRVQKSPPLVVTRAWGRSEFERCVVKSRKQFSLWTVLKFLEAMIFSSPAGPWGVPIPPIRPFVGVELSLGLIVCERAPPLGCD